MILVLQFYVSTVAKESFRLSSIARVGDRLRAEILDSFGAACFDEDAIDLVGFQRARQFVERAAAA